ncbi:MAG: pyridoxamine 5'-phosphate oxidase family protein [Candidatus Abyssobacteria bacterium SURF_5]|uniref:Pyridoxamine 5'-phosphate oxidase family protein n=1 Tax=Abyssobacteria bacterium (strain SURF_5) TaxID=2093360 RepID=A0A3A4NL60_ABYX5|nr:MAG: pyridoxamine 5'-phosphate oxidase family protein [Candidatus Abyssubacteria bacterium SURF_5]
MRTSKYFEIAIGRGVLATVDADGIVDIFLCPRPHVVDEETVAFLITDKTTHQNLQYNPRATYLFLEEGPEFSGRRLYLTKLREEREGETIEAIRTTIYPELREKIEALVYFRVDEVLPLTGERESKQSFIPA